MKKITRNYSKIEPGIIKTFRIYALLRFILTVITVPFYSKLIEYIPKKGIGENGVFGSRNFPSSKLPMNTVTIFELLMVSLFAFILVFYLNSDYIRSKFGKYYLPIGLMYAGISLVLEKQFLSPFLLFWQQNAFIYAIIIFIAWQYSFKTVVVSSVTYTGINIISEIIRIREKIDDSSLLEIQHGIMQFGGIIPELTTLLLIGFIVGRLIDSQKQQRVELTDAYHKLVQHSETVEQLTISRERNRLSRELHDTLAHTLSALSVQLQAILVAIDLKPKKAKAMIEDASLTAQNGLNETRLALKNLRASPLSEMGLTLSIQSQAEEYANRNAWQLQLTLPKHVITMPENVEQTFYRIFQECLNNIEKHSQTQHVAISLTETNEMFALNLTDNGIGFNMENAINGFGIQGMKERADLIRATLDINSSSEIGTSVTLVWRKNL